MLYCTRARRQLLKLCADDETNPLSLEIPELFDASIRENISLTDTPSRTAQSSTRRRSSGVTRTSIRAVRSVLLRVRVGACPSWSILLPAWAISGGCLMPFPLFIQRVSADASTFLFTLFFMPVLIGFAQRERVF